MPVNSNELKASVRLDGGAQFKKDLQDVNQNLKQLDAESKKVTEEFKGLDVVARTVLSLLMIAAMLFALSMYYVKIYRSNTRSNSENQ